MITVSDHYPFTLNPLPYKPNDLEPYIESETIILHHQVLQQRYVDNLNIALSRYPQYQDWSLKALVAYSDTFPPVLKNDIQKYAGGIFNHDIYFNSMKPGGSTPTTETLQQINQYFGSFENLKKGIKLSALSVFGSGYTWLICNGACQLQLINTANQDTPPLTIVSPLLNLDMWEHSYYLQYKTSKEQYVDNWMKVVDWNKTCDLLSCVNKRTNIQ